MDGLRLYFKFLRVSFRVQMQYLASFVLYASSNFFGSIIELFAVYALFQRFHALGEWTLGEVMIFYGMSWMAFSLSEAYLRGFDVFERLIRSGTFDRMLLRPRSVFLQVLGSEFQLLRIGRFLNGLIPLVIGAILVRPGWNVADWLFVMISIFAGSLTYGGVILIRAMVCFFTVESLELFAIFTNGGLEASSYPIDIYAGWLRNFFTYIIPLAAINYLPMSALLHKHYAPAWVSYLSPLLGAAFFGIGMLCWQFGVRHYKSTGS